VRFPLPATRPGEGVVKAAAAPLRSPLGRTQPSTQRPENAHHRDREFTLTTWMSRPYVLSSTRLAALNTAIENRSRVTLALDG
jgi:hypothetical protein